MYSFYLVSKSKKSHTKRNKKCHHEVPCLRKLHLYPQRQRIPCDCSKKAAQVAMNVQPTTSGMSTPKKQLTDFGLRWLFLVSKLSYYTIWGIKQYRLIRHNSGRCQQQSVARIGTVQVQYYDHTGYTQLLKQRKKERDSVFIGILKQNTELYRIAEEKTNKKATESNSA